MKANAMTAMRRLMLILCLTAIVHLSSNADSATPKTVLDYFLLMPEKYTSQDGASQQERRETLSNSKVDNIIDLKNDYLLMRCGSRPSMEAALFRYKGRVLVAVSYEFYDYQPPEFDFHLLRCENGIWREVTNELLPTPPDKLHHYTLPRYGTTVKVMAYKGKDDEYKGRVIDHLEWHNGKFVSTTKRRSTHETKRRHGVK